MSFRKRFVLLVLLDSLIVSCVLLFASWIAYPSLTAASMPVLIISSIALLFFHHLFAFRYKLYNKVWIYASIGELKAIAKAVTLSIIATSLVQFAVNDFSFYKRALIVTWMLHMLLVGGSRFIWRVYRDQTALSDNGKKRTLIVGAGSAGSMIARQLVSSSCDSQLYPVAFADDSLSKQQMHIYGVPVCGMTRDIASIVKQHRIDHIVIAIPSLQNNQLKRLVAQCSKTMAKVKMIPKIEDLASGKISVSNLKNVEVEDLLGREPVELDIDAISEYITGKTVMVTGAGGSIGSEICRQIMRFAPGKIVLVGHGEYSIYTIDMELRNQYKEANIEIVPVIGDVQDRKRIFQIVGEHEPMVIYHAAAHKHVPLMEYNPHEAVKNNIVGTRNVAEAADIFRVRTFILVSTDKAVNPTNVMGATKRISEMIVQNMDRKSKTIFAAVRFGNVLGSRGSVIPLFKDQIAAGGPVTVTDPEMTRYFMTIPEASRLVIQAGTLASGGEVFVLDMGEPVKIVDLARNLIRLSGFTKEEIPIVFSGIRPGEKMFEELLNDKEIHPGEIYEKIYVGKTNVVDDAILINIVKRHDMLDNAELKDWLLEIVSMEQKILTAQ